MLRQSWRSDLSAHRYGWRPAGILHLLRAATRKARVRGGQAMTGPVRWPGGGSPCRGRAFFTSATSKEGGRFCTLGARQWWQKGTCWHSLAEATRPKHVRMDDRCSSRRPDWRNPSFALGMIGSCCRYGVPDRRVLLAGVQNAPSRNGIVEILLGDPKASRASFQP